MSISVPPSQVYPALSTSHSVHLCLPDTDSQESFSKILSDNRHHAGGKEVRGEDKTAAGRCPEQAGGAQCDAARSIKEVLLSARAASLRRDVRDTPTGSTARFTLHLVAFFLLHCRE